jgi:hypothetical protein
MMVGVLGCDNNNESPAQPANNEHVSLVELSIKERILAGETEPGSVEFLKWGPHNETEGYYRCRYRILTKAGTYREFNYEIFMREGQVLLEHTTRRLTKQDREEISSTLSTIAEELAHKETAPKEPVKDTNSGEATDTKEQGGDKP